MSKNKKNKSKEPDGKERMKRRPSSDLSLRPKRFEFDIKKAYSQEQLAEIGAIALAWNQIEASVEFVLSTIFLFSPLRWELRQEIIKGIKSLKRKIELLRVYHKNNDVLNDKARRIIEITFSEVIQHKNYRNGIVHSTPFDHEKGIARYVDDSGEPWEILVTKEALTTFYKRLIFLLDELREISLLFRMTDPEGVVVNDKHGKPEINQRKALRERVIPGQLEKILQYQKARQSLPQLPRFPDEHLIRLMPENTEANPNLKEIPE